VPGLAVDGTVITAAAKGCFPFSAGMSKKAAFDSRLPSTSKTADTAPPPALAPTVTASPGLGFSGEAAQRKVAVEVAVAVAVEACGKTAGAVTVHPMKKKTAGRTLLKCLKKEIIFIGFS
jgi:hypothetical protein